MSVRPVKLPWGRWGPTADPRGAIVRMEWQGRTLLGRIVAMRRDEGLGQRLLTVRHFNGEPWPVEPVYFAVDVIPPDYAPEVEP